MITANVQVPQKAGAMDFKGRFREIISDPLNLLLHRHPRAGIVEGDLVTLHNGLKVPHSGPGSYYGDFSDILILNRGVHEPLEEYAFQQLLPHMPDAPTMIELGAYWGHYSMWMQQARPDTSNWLVEPDTNNLKAGQQNFQRHGFNGQFVQSFVGRSHFTIDQFMADNDLDHLDLLHSDIQGFECEMLDGAAQVLNAGRVSYAFVSTHSQALHRAVCERLTNHGFRVELSADFAVQTTSHDGFVMAVRQDLPRIIPEARPLDRVDICQAQPEVLWASLAPFLLPDQYESAA